jgi:hypothetical protein
METLRMTAKPGKHGRVIINVPPRFRSRKLDLVVVLNEISNTAEKKTGGEYDFASLQGRLRWKGNALKEQKRLRNEW